MSQPGTQKAAIIGSGNIGTDLLMKMRTSSVLSPSMLVGIDPESDGLSRARELGVATTHEGIEGLLADEIFDDIVVVFDATSAKAHLSHATTLKAAGKQVVDLTPAAVGPYVVPVVNLREYLDAPNVNMVTCGGQATIPIVHAVSRVAPVKYGEIVASISSRSAGPGTRANIDEFTETTARGIEVIGGAERGKAIIVLNPADPPLLMRNTVFALTETNDEAAVTESIEQIVADVAKYVPGYRMVQPPQFDHHFQKPLSTSDGEWRGMQVSVFLEVEGAGDWLPAYAGNLDIMTSAALEVGELLAQREGGA